MSRRPIPRRAPDRLLRLRSLKTQAIRFCLVGSSGVVLDLGIYQALRASGLAEPAGRALAIAAALVWNFTWNRRLTFAPARSGRPVPQFARYLCANAAGACLSWTTAMLLGLVLPGTGTGRIGAALCGIGVGAASNFLLSARWVFASASGNRSSPSGTVADQDARALATFSASRE